MNLIIIYIGPNDTFAVWPSLFAWSNFVVWRVLAKEIASIRPSVAATIAVAVAVIIHHYPNNTSTEIL